MSIKKFQKKHGLTPDGIVGPKTIGTFRDVFKLNNVETAHFFGQIAHETANFKYDTENLNYSAKGLMKVFRKYFPDQEIANRYARKPKKIGSRVYANRMGNGNEASGDGYKFRGRGAIQLTGFDNYKSFSDYMKDLYILTKPNTVAEGYFLESAIFYFEKRRLFRFCKDVGYNSIRKVTRLINGGYNGLQHRYDLTLKYYNLLNKYDNETNSRTEHKKVVDNNTSSSGSIPINSQQNTKKKNGKSSNRVKNVQDKRGFFAKIIGWFL